MIQVIGTASHERCLRERTAEDLDDADQLSKIESIRVENDMSQFVMCYSHQDLSKFQCKKLSQNSTNKVLFEKVANEILGHVEYDKIWVMENSDDYFIKTQRVLVLGVNFKNTLLFSIINNMCDICEIMIFWYGSEFKDLDVVTNKEDMFINIEESVNDSICECYLLFEGIK